jgi:hypothetical protein
MMFVFLPLLAAVMLLLYWRRGGFTSSIWCSVCTTTPRCSWPSSCSPACCSWPTGVAAAGAGDGRHLGDRRIRRGTCGAPCRYYGQGRLLTFAKFALLGLAYLACLMLTLLGATLVSLLQA